MGILSLILGFVGVALAFLNLYQCKVLVLYKHQREQEQESIYSRLHPLHDAAQRILRTNADPDVRKCASSISSDLDQLSGDISTRFKSDYGRLPDIYTAASFNALVNPRASLEQIRAPEPSNKVNRADETDGRS